MALRAKAAALVNPIKLRIKEMLRGDGDGRFSRMLLTIQRFRKCTKRVDPFCFDQIWLASRGSWFETRGVAALLTMRT